MLPFTVKLEPTNKIEIINNNNQKCSINRANIRPFFYFLWSNYRAYIQKNPNLGCSMTVLGCTELYLQIQIFQGQAAECILLHIFKLFEKIWGF